MRLWTLRNGMRLIYEHRPTDSVAVQLLVNVGSNNEHAQVRGISHFIEHMVFEGTAQRPHARDIANEIERVGGELNAYTTNQRTCFYAKVLGKHIDVALDVLGDVLQNPLFRPDDVERQKSILFKEIDLVTDEPRFHQWILFQQTIFKNHPSRHPTYGSRRTVQSITAGHIQSYFRKHYYPKNMTLVVVGDVPNIKEKAEHVFVINSSKSRVRTSFAEPLQKKIRVKHENRDVANTYVVLGHRMVRRDHKDSFVLDVIDAVLGRGQSGWMFDEIRNRHGLAYDVGTQYVVESDYGYFATYVSVDKKNIGRVRLLILDQLERLQRLTPEELREAQMYLEGDYYLSHEDTQKLADEICFWDQMGDAREYKNYVARIKRVTLADVRRVARTYFSRPYCMVVIKGKK